MEEADHWINAADYDTLVQSKDKILLSDIGGVDIAFADIMDILGIDEIEDEELKAQWFDRCIARYRKIFRAGDAVLYRAIAVDDVDSFLSKVRLGKSVGYCWTDDRSSASTDLHGGEWRRHNLFLTALVAPSSVEWSTTLQLNFGHPEESEIRVGGEIRIFSIVQVETGEELFSSLSESPKNTGANLAFSAA